jgi:hypothetical protein
MQLEKGTNMKKSIPLTILLVSVIFLPTFVQAQGTLQASNLGQTPTSSAAIGSDSWIAQEFYIFGTDPTIYDLNSIQLLTNPASGNPSDFNVSIYSAGNLGGSPKNFLGSLNGSTDPSLGGVFTYTASDITLSGDIGYYVVVTAATSIAQGAYSWSASNNAGTGNWNITDIYYSSADGLNWTGHARQDVFQMAIYATPVPEPSTCALLGLSLFGLGFWRLQQKTAK